MGTTSDKLTYLNGTKSAIKDSINLGGGTLTTEPFREYASAIKDRYLDFMNNGIDVIWGNWEKVVGEGTSLTLSNTVEAPMKVLLKGNTSQEGTPTPDTPQEVHTVSGDNEVLIRNIQLWDEILEHGGYNLTTGEKNNTNYYRSANFISITPNTQMTFRKPVGEYTRVLFYDINKNFISSPDVIYTNYLNTHFTSPENAYFMTFLLDYISATYNNDIMVYYGNTNHDYEPYQRTTYPINLPVENLLETKITTQTKNGVTITHNEDGSYTLNGTATSGFAFESAKYSKTFKKGTYILGSSVTMPTGLFYSLLEANTYYFYTRVGIDTATHTFDENTTINQFREYMWVANGTTFDNFVLKPQLEKGNKVNSYNKYGTTPIELCKIGTYQDRFIRNSGKNKFDINNDYNSVNYGTYNVNGNELIVSSNSITDPVIGVYQIINVKPNTDYMLTGNLKSGLSNARLAIQYRTTESSNWENYSNIKTGVGTISQSINTGNYAYIRLLFYWCTSTPSTITPAVFENIMLELGTTATSYEPYGNGDWYLKKETGKVVLDGSESWANYTNLGNNSRCYYIKPNAFSLNSQLFSNYFIKSNLYETDETGIIINPYGTSLISIKIPNSDLETQDLAGYKTWLSTHNTTVYYVLATPTYTKIEGTLSSQLEEVYRAKSYENETNIYQSNNDLPFVLSVSALKEI